MYSNLAIFRFYLACAVVVFHLYGSIAPQSGTQAVFLFFLVSGFLMTQLLEETYKGRYREFLKNRVLRIYPTYFFAVFAGLLVVLSLPVESRVINPALQLPPDLKSWVKNIFIFGLFGENERLVPVAWSLNTELNFYITFLVISFLTLRIRLVLLIAFIPLPFIYVFLDKGFYGHYFGSGIAFSIGALFYIFRDKVLFPFSLQVSALLMIPIIMFVIPYALDFKSAEIKGIGWSLHVLILIVAFVAFELFLNKGASPRYMAISKFLGDLSYPVFLLHWPSSVLTFHLFSIEKNTLMHLVIAFVITLLLSMVVYFAVERPIMTIRSKIRGYKV